MLVLSRKPNEEILIGDNIKVTVLKVKGNTVRIGIEAPPAVKVKRGELPDARPANQQPVRSEMELTLSFSPSEEGVSAGKENVAKREPAARRAHADVLKFEPSVTTTRRNREEKPSNLSAEGLLPLSCSESADRSQGTNRIKEILSRLVTGVPTDDLGND
ncbi:MAG: carbon storage regulator [Planctomycetota bacterium]